MVGIKYCDKIYWCKYQSYCYDLPFIFNHDGNICFFIDEKCTMHLTDYHNTYTFSLICMSYENNHCRYVPGIKI